MKSPIIIIGAPRSGTSMMMSSMRHILGYAGHNEAHFFTLLDQLLQTSEEHCRELRKDFDRKSNVLLFDPVLHIDRDLKKLFKNYLTEIYGDKPWFLKTPNSRAVQALPLMLEFYPEASVIYMKRRGIENVLSQSRKFGNGSFNADYCTQWSDCITSFFTGNYADRSLVIDQLAYLQRPDMLITKLLDHLNMDASAGLKARLKKYILSNPVEKTADLTPDYIALEETPWTEDEKETFLELCEGAMKISGYPVSRAEINAFQADDAFLFSGNWIRAVKLINVQTPWNSISQDVFQPSKLHPNAVLDEKLTLFLRPPTATTRIGFKMLNPKLTGKGVSISIEELDRNEKVIQRIDEINLQCLERIQVQLQSIVNQPIYKIEITNETGSQNYNYKLLEMQVLQPL